MRRSVLFTLFTLFSFQGQAQTIVDTCFTSVPIGPSFVSTGDLTNSTSSDLLSWDGFNWNGYLPNAHVTLPPPSGNANCRAIFLGNGVTWSSGGEGFAVKLNSPLITGQQYSFPITYVSHGTGSDGNFSPLFYTGNPTLTGVTFLGNLPSVGNTWTTNVVSFTASSIQNGDTWLLFRSGTGSTGLISSFCKTCTEPANCNVDLGPDQKICSQDTIVLTPITTNGTLTWLDGTSSSSFLVTEPGWYGVSLTFGSCVDYDSVYISLHNSASAQSFGRDCSCHIYIPNAFTPNEDEFNSVFGPISDCPLDIYQFQIYDRWGQKVFESYDSSVSWDGTILNTTVPNGLYMYTLRYRFASDSETKFISGHINVL
jgi:gliding motility-associated-like protein